MAREQTQETRVASASESTAIIHLIDIPDPSNDRMFRITDWTDYITFPEDTGERYRPWDVELEEIPIDQSSEVERTRLSLTNVNLQMRTILRENDGLQDEPVRIRKVHPYILGGEDDVLFDITYYVEQPSWEREDAVLDLRSPFDRAHRRLTNTVTRERFPGIPRRRAFIQ